MDDRLCLGALNAESVNVAHNVMTDKLFTLFGNIVVNVVGVGFHFVNLLLGYAETEFVLSFCKCNPEFAPCFKFKIG